MTLSYVTELAQDRDLNSHSLQHFAHQPPEFLTVVGDCHGKGGEAGVERVETRRQEELAHAWDVVVHRGCVPMRTLLGFRCRDFSWPIRRSQFAGSDQVVFEDLMHVWCLVSGRNE